MRLDNHQPRIRIALQNSTAVPHFWLVRNANFVFAVAASFIALGTPPAYAENSAPTISFIGNRGAQGNFPIGPIGFIVGDNETAAGALSVSGHSSNRTLVPDSNIVFGGSGSDRTVTVIPAANRSGRVVITVTVSDGQLDAQSGFELNVVLPPTFNEGPWTYQINLMTLMAPSH
jgi:hypothetical protein